MPHFLFQIYMTMFVYVDRQFALKCVTKYHWAYNVVVVFVVWFNVLRLVGWLIVFGLNGPLSQYFSLYRAVTQREGEREEK